MKANVTEEEERKKQKVLKLLTILTLLFIGVETGLKNYLLFHTLVELTSVIVSIIMLIIAFNTYNLSNNS